MAYKYGMYRIHMFDYKYTQLSHVSDLGNRLVGPMDLFSAILGPFYMGLIFTFPLKLIRVGREHQFETQIEMTISRKCFREDICQLLMRGNIRQRDYICDKLLPNEVTVDLCAWSAHGKQCSLQCGWHWCCLHRVKQGSKEMHQILELIDEATQLLCLLMTLNDILLLRMTQKVLVVSCTSMR